MRRAPISQLPASPGPWVSTLRCTETSEGLKLDGKLFTGVLVSLAEGSPSVDFDRLRLERYFDGSFADAYVDDIMSIDTSMSLEFTDDHHGIKFPPEPTALVQLHRDAPGDCFLAGPSTGASLRFDAAGNLTSICRTLGPEGNISGFWYFYDNGRVKSAAVRCDDAEPALLSVSFDPDGRLETFRIEGEAHTLLPAVAERQDYLWLPTSISHIFGFDVAPTLKLPWAPDYEAEILKATPNWRSQVQCLDLSGAIRFDLARDVIETLQPTSLELGWLSPGRNTFLHGGEEDDAQLMRLGCDFLSAGGEEVLIDRCSLGSTNSNATNLLRRSYSVILFDAAFEHLVGLSGTLRPLYLHLMEASPNLEYAWFPGSDRNKQLEPLRSQHPQAHFDDSYEEREQGKADFDTWLRSVCNG